MIVRYSRDAVTVQHCRCTWAVTVRHSRGSKTGLASSVTSSRRATQLGDGATANLRRFHHGSGRGYLGQESGGVMDATCREIQRVSQEFEVDV